MMKLLDKIISNSNVVKKTQKKFLKTIIITIFSLTGKVNFRNMSRYCDLSEKTISRNFRKELDSIVLNKDIILSTYIPNENTIAAVDCSFIKKSGKKTYGLDVFWSGTDSKAKKGLEITGLAIVDTMTKQSFMLDTKQTPDFEKSEKKENNRMDFYLKQCEDSIDHLTSLGIKTIAADGAYAKNKFTDGIDALGLTMVSKLRKDANLRYLYTGKKKKGRGRPKKYEGKVDMKEPFFEFVKELEDGVDLYEKIVYSISLKRKIKIAYIHNSKNKKKREYVILFSTDTNMEAQTIVTIYRARFQIEFLFRDAKQHTGLSDCQSTNKKALNFHFNISMIALNFAKAEHARGKNMVFSMNNYRRKYSIINMLNYIYSKLHIIPDFTKNKLAYEEILNYGAIG